MSDWPGGEGTFAKVLRCLSDACRSAVITFARLGAAGRRHGEDGGVLAYPYRLHDRCKDETGAGDAFAAGLVDCMTRKPSDTLSSAMSGAREWASYACEHHGGASGCPTSEELRRWSQTHQIDAVAEVTKMLDGQLDALLGLYDQALDC
jgi:sugar/nucleoside kinase (ribokinase family)